MQPYAFPYIGYFQMINAVEKFVFYDDVNYIKGGWVNRNQILNNNEKQYFTIPLVKASPNKLISEIEINIDSKEYLKLKQKIQLTYSKSPYFDKVSPLIEDILNKKYNRISEFAIKSTIEICNYLGIKTHFFVSSIDFAKTKGLDRAERLIEICRKENCNTYINAIGGQELYTKDYFVELKAKLNDETKCFHRINERFVKSKQFVFQIDSINCLKNYTDFVIVILDTKESIICHFKVRIKHQSYFQMRKDVAIAFYQIIKEHHVPNNYIEHENVKNIWEFDFSKIDFLKSK